MSNAVALSTLSLARFHRISIPIPAGALALPNVGSEFVENGALLVEERCHGIDVTPIEASA